MGLAESEVVLCTMFPFAGAVSTSVEQARESAYPKTLPKRAPPAMPARTSFDNDPILIYECIRGFLIGRAD